MSALDQLPDPPRLALAPELAILAVLELLLQVTTHVLAAEQPKLLDDELPYWVAQKERPSFFSATSIIELVPKLIDAINAYRADVTRELDDLHTSRNGMPS